MPHDQQATHGGFAFRWHSIGGIELGLERTGGFKTVWQVECDPYAQAVLRKHWPDVGRWDDVRTFPPAPAEDWRCDVICGGFPCQDISNAGKRAGIDGERSGLWSEYIRIVRALRPRFVLVENVAALLGRGLGRVLGDLAASGYDAEWQCLPAAAFGAPHIRERVFILAYANGHEQTRRYLSRREAKGRTAASGCREDVADAEVVSGELRGSTGERQGRPASGGADVSYSNSQRLERPKLQRERICIMQRIGDNRWWATEPDVGRVANGVPSRVDRLRCLGNAVVPAVAQWIGERILEAID